jgi:hypothetical protein
MNRNHMNHSIKQGIVPPHTGLEREEPEIGQEEDIPSDDEPATDEPNNPSARESQDRPPRKIERE